MNTMTQPNAPGATRTNIDRLVYRFAGLFVLVSLVLSQVHSVQWLWFTAFVGANLFQSSFTGFCPLALLLQRLGFKPGTAFCAAHQS
jgi:hypothetical protein